MRYLVIAALVLAACGDNLGPETPRQLVPPPDGEPDLVIVASNQTSFDTVDLQLRLDRIPIVTGDFPIDEQHRFEFDVFDGPHDLIASSSQAELVITPIELGAAVHLVTVTVVDGGAGTLIEVTAADENAADAGAR